MANRVSQVMAEVLQQPFPANVNLRVSQVMVEVLQTIALAKPVRGGGGKWFFTAVWELGSLGDVSDLMGDLGENET